MWLYTVPKKCGTRHKNQAFHGRSKCCRICLVSGPDICRQKADIIEEGWKQKARQRLNRFFQIDRDKTARAAGNRINFSPQTDATTFALPSVSILLLCPTYTIASTLVAAVKDSVLMRRFRLFLLRRTADGMTVGYWKVWNWKQYLLHYFTTRRWAKW